MEPVTGAGGENVAFAVSIPDHFIDSVHEAVEQQALQVAGTPGVGRLNWRGCSVRKWGRTRSPAVSNLFATGTALDEFGILRGHSFEPVDRRSDVFGG